MGLSRVVVQSQEVESPDIGFTAWVEGISAIGRGPTEADALRDLVTILVDFVEAHDKSLRKIRETLKLKSTPQLIMPTEPKKKKGSRAKER